MAVGAASARLQAAAAGYGQLALECRDVTTVIERGVELVSHALEMPMAALFRVVAAERVEVVRGWGSLREATGVEFAVPATLVATTDWSAGPLVVDDWRWAQSSLQPTASRLDAVRSSLAVSVPAEGRPYTLAVMDTEVRRLQDVEVDFVQSVAHLLAAAMERHRHETAQAAVAAFGRFALESRSITVTLQRAVNLVTEVLDTSIGFLVRPVGTDRVEVLHGCGPLGEAFGGETELPHSLVGALHSSTPSMTPPVQRFTRPGTPRHAGVASLTVAVPVSGEPCRLGVADADARRFSDPDADFLVSIALLLAAAIERHRIEARLHETSAQLRQALLPAALPVLEGIESAARYVPAGRDQVGGDWYDVLPQQQGRIVLVMGDVEGHDMTAAAVMGQVRNVLRAYVAEGHPLAEIMTRANRFVAGHTDLLVTCCCAELCPSELTVTCVSAGHPVPVVLESNGATWSLPVRPATLLGVDPEQDYEEYTTLLPAGCCLLLVTDGLVDDCDSAVHSGFAAFSAAAAALADQPVEQMVDQLVRRPPGAPDPIDDAALLAVRLAPSTMPSASAAKHGAASRVFMASPAANPAARRFAVDVLAGWGLAELCDAAALVVSELVTNVVMHTTSSVKLTLRRLADAGVWIGVHDTNDRLPIWPAAVDPDIDLAPGGRGLSIVDQIAHSWGVRPTPDSGGKTVWLELWAAGMGQRTRPSAPQHATRSGGEAGPSS